MGKLLGYCYYVNCAWKNERESAELLRPIPSLSWTSNTTILPSCVVLQSAGSAHGFTVLFSLLLPHGWCDGPYSDACSPTRFSASPGGVPFFIHGVREPGCERLHSDTAGLHVQLALQHGMARPRDRHIRLQQHIPSGLHRHPANCRCAYQCTALRRFPR